jgi:integrase/recombinase XerD
MRIDEAVANFISHMRRKGYRDLTVGHNQRGLRKFAAFMAHRKILDVKKVKREDVQAYKEHLYFSKTRRHNRPRTAATQQLMLLYVVVFFRHLVQEGHLEKNPTASLILPRLERKISRNWLSQKEMADLLETMDLKTVTGLYDRTIFEFAYSTGVRINELWEIRLDEVNLEDGLVKISTAKGGIERMVPLTSLAQAFLEFYMATVRPLWLRGRRSPYLFPTSRGTKQLPRYVIDRLGGYVKLAGISKKISFHGFRRSAATALLEAGVDIRLIQALLGHRSIISTQAYLVTTTKDLREVLIHYHPGEVRFSREASRGQVA